MIIFPRKLEVQKCNHIFTNLKTLIKFSLFHFLHELLTGHFFNTIGDERSSPCLKKEIAS